MGIFTESAPAKTDLVQYPQCPYISQINIHIYISRPHAIFKKSSSVGQSPSLAHMITSQVKCTSASKIECIHTTVFVSMHPIFTPGAL